MGLILLFGGPLELPPAPPPAVVTYGRPTVGVAPVDEGITAMNRVGAVTGFGPNDPETGIV